MRVLVAEDERKIAALLRGGLAASGFNVVVASRGDDALHLATQERFDAVMLDIMMPGLDGLAVLRRLRAAGVSTPVILISARGAVTEKIEGLNLGADDYIAKPFSIDEVVARLNAVCRRTDGRANEILAVGDLSLNRLTREVRRAGNPVELTAREFSLLEHLMRSPGSVLTRAHLCEAVWEYHFDPGTNVVDVAVRRLRRKLDDPEGELVRSVRGVGYTLESPNREPKR